MEGKLLNKNTGFTLIELMIVVSVIVIIAAIAIPVLLRSRLAANESHVIGSLKTLASAEAGFQATGVTDADADGTGEYGSLALPSNATPPFIDSSLGSGQKSGFFITVTTTGVANSDEIMWDATAYPIGKGQTGNRTFYIDESGVLRGSDIAGGVGAPGIPATRAMAVPSFGGNFPAIQ